MKKNKYYVEFHYCVEVLADDSGEAGELGIQEWHANPPSLDDMSMEVTNTGEEDEDENY